MNRARALAVSMACAAMGASATVHAQARGPTAREVRGNDMQVENPLPVLDEVSRTRKTAEMKAWLRRLVGLFRVDAIQTVPQANGGRDRISRLDGTANCSGIGEGSGVRCIIRYVLRPSYRADSARQDPQLPAGTLWNLVETAPILYFGIKPDTAEIQVLAVNSGSVAARSGVLAGDTVGFSVDNWKVCEVWNVCYVVSEITVEPAGEISMKVAADFNFPGPNVTTKSGHNTEMELHLHREPSVDAGTQREWP